jgi:Flp pilus assembly protein TadD
MDGRREQLLFLGTLVLVALLSWMKLGDSYTGSRPPSAKSLVADPVAVPAAMRFGAPEDGPAGQREESVFAPPRELLPLDPLLLPEPPLPLLSVRRPAVHPGLAGAHAKAYRIAADQLGSLDLEQGAIDLGAALLEGPDGDEDGPLGAGFGGGDPDAGGDEDLAGLLEARYDWVVRDDGGPRLYGSILNPDPVALASRPGEDLRFQQVSSATGGPLGVPFRVARGNVIEFGLARTFENSYRIRSAQLGRGSGSAAQRRALALEMLTHADNEPHALEFAETEAILALEASPTDPDPARLLAAVRRERFDVEGELTVYQAAVANGSADPALIAGYARLARRLGLHERAWELLETARTAGRPAAEVATLEGVLLADAGRHDEALAALRGAENLPFSGPLESLQKQDLTLSIGETLVALGQPDAALREANRVLLDNPDNARGLILLGAVEAARDRLDDAASAFGAAQAADPRSARAISNAGIMAWRRGDGGGARRLLDMARDVNPLDAVAPTLALGFLYEDAGELETARDIYAEALELEPGDAEALYRLGRNQRRDGDPGGAVSTLREALRLAGPDVLLLLELGRASMERGRHEDALRYVREAERLEPDDGEVQWNLGLAALYSGDTFSCREPLQRAVDAGLGGAHVALAVSDYRRGDADSALDHLDEVAKAYAGDAEHPQAVYAASQAALIRDNLSKFQWLDRFGRTSLQRGWTEHMWDGSPRVFLSEQGVTVTGRMERAREDERPGISRPVEGRVFFAAQAELVPGGSDTRCGLSLTHRQLRGAEGMLPKASLQIYVDTDGQVRMSALDNFDTQVLDGEPVPGVVVLPGESVLLGIERLDEVTGRFGFTLDGEPVGSELELRALRKFRNPFELSAWAEAAPGRSAAADITLVRIVQVP